MLNDNKQKKKVECFEDLFIWQRAVEFAKNIYSITEKKGLKTVFGLKEQMRRASVSISCIIAEEFVRRSRKEYLNFLNIAKGSAGEIRSQLYIAFEIGYLEKTEMENLFQKEKSLSGSITNHAKAIGQFGKPV